MLKLYTQTPFRPYLLFTFLALMAFQPVRGQQLGFYLNGGIPAETFAENVQSGVFGFQMNLMTKLGNSPIYAGGAVNVGCYAMEEWDAYFAVGEDVIDATHTLSSSMVDAIGLLRIQPVFCNLVQPYGQVSFGAGLMYTEYEIESPTAGIDCNVDEYYNAVLNRRLTPVYGVGAGVQVRLSDARNCFAPYLDLGVDYRNSGQVEYMYDDLATVFRSRTNMWNVHAGVTVKLP